jgi:hypothetical protein
VQRVAGHDRRLRSPRRDERIGSSHAGDRRTSAARPAGVVHRPRRSPPLPTT